MVEVSAEAGGTGYRVPPSSGLDTGYRVQGTGYSGGLGSAPAGSVADERSVVVVGVAPAVVVGVWSPAALVGVWSPAALVGVWSPAALVGVWSPAVVVGEEGRSEKIEEGVPAGARATCMGTGHRVHGPWCMGHGAWCMVQGAVYRVQGT